MGSLLTHNKVLITGAVALVVVVGIAAAVAMSTWGEIERVGIDRPTAASTPVNSEEKDAAVSEEPITRRDGDEPFISDPGDGVDVFLLVGSDSRESLASLEGFGAFGGHRADVVMVLMRTPGEAALLSLPRDLWIDSPCSRGETRLNQALEGCGEVLNGPTALTIAVEGLIGETVDHFAMVDLAGFQAAVDAAGGYEICVENPVRDRRAALELPAGCTLASGAQALAWLRSRHTQELTTDGWRAMPGVSDLARNERQRAFLIDMMGRLADFSSPQALASTAKAIAPYITIDSELSLLGAVDVAWTLRSLESGALAVLEVPVHYYVTDDGASVLLPSTPVDVIVAGFLAHELAGDSSRAMG